MVLLMALGVMGTAYGAWVDEIYIEGNISTGNISTSLTCGLPYLEGNPTGADTDIDCDPAGSMLLNIEVSNAQLDTDYYCPFKVNNAVGSLPIKIASLSLTNSITGVTELIEDITVGTVIDPGTSATGKVHIYLTTGAMVGEDIPVTLEVTVERWND